MHCAPRGKSPSVTTEKTFTADPWCLREPELDLDVLASTEAVLTLANGNLGVRGTLDEGEPVGHPGTYLAGVHELRTMVYTETGNGDPEATETLVDTIDGTVVRLLVDGHPLDVRTGTLQQHERVLDFRAGTLERRLRWRSPGDRCVEVTSTRLVSLDQRGVFALRYTVRALDQPSRSCCSPGWSPTCESRTCRTTRAGRTSWRTRCRRWSTALSTAASR
jgi:alpha,alpha-trehalose phosphorylase